MKKITALLLIFALVAGFMAGCSQEMHDPTQQTTQTDPTIPTQTEPTVSTVPTEPHPEASDVTVHEVMPDNKKLCMGHENDWVELYNREDTEVLLDGYFLTDDPQKPELLSLAGMTIPADGYLVITLDDNAPFRLSKDGEAIYLTFDGAVISGFQFGAAENGEAFDETGVCAYPTPGQPNTEEGYYAYLQTLVLPELIISEVMSSNSKYLPVGGKYYDLVEVKNNSDAPLDLSAYALTDKHSEPDRYRFPAVTLQPGEYFVIYCSGETKLGNNHTSFKLSADGETVYLSKDGAFIDVLTVPGDLAKNESYGRVGNIAYYLEAPTFGAENAAGYKEPIAAPAADIPSGVYDSAITLTLTGEGDIYYTLDGSCPTLESAKYTEPISIDGVTTVRTFCTNGTRTSITTAYTYLVGVSHTLPIVSISIPQELLSGEEGILNNIDKTYEYEAMLTMIEDGEEKFSVPFGFRLHGNDSRKGAKQNFQLRFRSEYGVGKLEYKLFDDLDIAQFNSLLLKGGSERWAANMLCDELATGIAHQTTNLYTQAMKPVVLYLGGEFWGVYFFRERFSDEYVASHLDVSAESVDLLHSTTGSVQNGSNADFQALKAFVSENDMSLDENYAYLTEKIDVLSLIDWYICRSYVGDHDFDNIRRFRSSETDGKWRWMYFDLDWSFWGRPDDKPVTWSLNEYCGEKKLINAVLANAAGRDLFLSRYAELMGTVLNEEYIIGLLDSMVETILPEMEKDRDRWGCSFEGWENSVENIRKFVRDGVRTQGILNDLQNYFELTDAEMEYYFAQFMQ